MLSLLKTCYAVFYGGAKRKLSEVMVRGEALTSLNYSFGHLRLYGCANRNYEFIDNRNSSLSRVRSILSWIEFIASIGFMSDI